MNNNNGYERFMKKDAVAKYLTLGQSRAVEFCRAIGAEKRIGRRVIYDRKVIDDFFDGEDCFYFPDKD